MRRTQKPCSVSARTVHRQWNTDLNSTRARMTSTALSQHRCFFLKDLPPELRIRIYDYLVVYRSPLMPLVASRAHSKRIASYMDVLLINRQIYDEAAGHFYSFNEFQCTFDELCHCFWGYLPTIALNAQRFRHVRIDNIVFADPTSRAPEPCRVCFDNGNGLLDVLCSISFLHSVILSFADLQSFVKCYDTLTVERAGSADSMITASDIGAIHVSGGRLRIELRQPSLIQTWPVAAPKAKYKLDIKDYFDKMEGDYVFDTREDVCSSHLFMHAILLRLR